MIETVEHIKETPAVAEHSNSVQYVAELKHLKKSFNDNHVLVDINLSLKKGENVVILGKSGSGKSVLIKCLVRLIDADEGELIVFDKNISDLNSDELNTIRKKIGFLFQSGALYDSMSVRENLAFPLRDRKDITKEEKNKLIDKHLQT